MHGVVSKSPSVYLLTDSYGGSPYRPVVTMPVEMARPAQPEAPAPPPSTAQLQLTPQPTEVQPPLVTPKPVAPVYAPPPAAPPIQPEVAPSVLAPTPRAPEPAKPFKPEDSALLQYIMEDDSGYAPSTDVAIATSLPHASMKIQGNIYSGRIYFHCRHGNKPNA